jgi:hypothetical protein
MLALAPVAISVDYLGTVAMPDGLRPLPTRGAAPRADEAILGRPTGAGQRERASTATQSIQA